MPNQQAVSGRSLLPSKATEMSHRPLHLTDQFCALLWIHMVKIPGLWLNHVRVITTDTVCCVSNLLRATGVVTDMAHFQWLCSQVSEQPQVALVTFQVSWCAWM